MCLPSKNKKHYKEIEFLIKYRDTPAPLVPILPDQREGPETNFIPVTNPVSQKSDNLGSKRFPSLRYLKPMDRESR